MPKPVVFTDSREPDEKFSPEVVESFQPGAVPGYDEQIKANSIAAADDLVFREHHKEAINPITGKQGASKEDYYKVFGTGPRELDHALSWQRYCGPTGASSQHARNQWARAQREGWRPLRADELKALNPHYEVPLAASVEADGLIHREDVVLCVRSGTLERRWQQYHLSQARDAEGTLLPQEFRDGDFSAPTFTEPTERTTLTVQGKKT